MIVKGLAQFTSAAVFSLLISACVYVPPVWDIQDPNNSVDSIKVGETTRSQVLSLFGNTPSVCAGTSTQDSKWYRYSGTQSAGRLAYADGNGRSLAETPWYLNIYFNDSGIVEAVDTNPPPSADAKVMNVTFGDPSEPNATSAMSSELFLDRSCPQP